MDQENPLDIFNEEQAVRDLVVSICTVLYEHGINEVHVGGLMRLVGIDEETAQNHDDELMVLTDLKHFVKEGDATNIIEEVMPPGTTLH